MISTSALVSAPVRTRLPSRIRMSLPEAGCLALSSDRLPPSTSMVAMTLSCACATGAGIARHARIAGSAMVGLEVEFRDIRSLNLTEKRALAVTIQKRLQRIVDNMMPFPGQAPYTTVRVTFETELHNEVLVIRPE